MPIVNLPAALARFCKPAPAAMAARLPAVPCKKVRRVTLLLILYCPFLYPRCARRTQSCFGKQAQKGSKSYAKSPLSRPAALARSLARRLLLHRRALKGRIKHERTGRIEQVAGWRGARTRPASEPLGNNQRRSCGADRPDLRHGRKGAPEHGNHGFGRIPGICAARPFHGYESGNYVPARWAGGCEVP